MPYYSTGGKAPVVSFKEAVLAGLAPDGGLYLPTELPRIPDDCLEPTRNLEFAELAFRLLEPFTDGQIAENALHEICEDAFDFPVEMAKITEELHALELFRGPTFAFKDFGARFLARVMNHFLAGSGRRLTILVATSGDTGSAVAHGFTGMEAIDVVLLYPSGRVSRLQEQQLTTLGGNVSALEVMGSFDDCQNMVKAAFADDEIQRRRPLSSANSINIGRLLPQMTYYVHALRLLSSAFGDTALCVPSGNFGNVTGALMARLMGLKTPRIVVGTNANDVVPRYLNTGFYEPRPSVRTPASAMDVGQPSNFDRLMALLGESHEKMREVFRGYVVTTPEMLETIGRVRREHGYLLDPHSAVGYSALERYMAEAGTFESRGFFAATAHPGKFAEAIEEATGEAVEIPDALAEALRREKRAVPIGSRPEELKAFLLDSSLTS